VALVVVLLVCVSSCASSFAARKQQQLAAPSSVDFGSITVGTSSTQSLIFTNMGASNTTISGATVTGSGFSFKGPVLPLNLRPGTSATFSVSFLPPTPGSAQGSLSFSGKQNSVTVALGGTGVQPSISIAPSSISFGNMRVGVTSSQTITLSNPGNTTLDNAIHCSQRRLQHDRSERAIDADTRTNCKIFRELYAERGWKPNSSVTLVSNAPTSPVRLSLSGRVRASPP